MSRFSDEALRLTAVVMRHQVALMNSISELEREIGFDINDDNLAHAAFAFTLPSDVNVGHSEDILRAL